MVSPRSATLSDEVLVTSSSGSLGASTDTTSRLLTTLPHKSVKRPSDRNRLSPVTTSQPRATS